MVGEDACGWLSFQLLFKTSLLFEPSSVIDYGWWVMTEGKK